MAGTCKDPVAPRSDGVLCPRSSCPLTRQSIGRWLACAALAGPWVTPRALCVLPTARREGRREEDEDEEARDEEHRDGPRHDGGPAALVGFHGSQTPPPPNLLRPVAGTSRTFVLVLSDA